MLRVGAIKYINALPLFQGIQTGHVPHKATIVEGVPTVLNELLNSRKLDMALISSAEYIAHKEQYVLLPRFCIAADSEVMSVCLFSKYDIKDLSGKRIGVTAESMTSVQLLQILCHHFWKVEPEFETMTSHHCCTSYDAFLLIGDCCLLYDAAQDYVKIDLATEWNQKTGLPFVFAVLATCKEAAIEKKEEIEAFCLSLETSLQWAKDNPEMIFRQASNQCHLPYEMLKRYYALLQHEMDERRLEALKLYQELLANFTMSTTYATIYEGKAVDHPDDV